MLAGAPGFQMSSQTVRPIEMPLTSMVAGPVPTWK
jgi:hypothetical protein